MPWLLQQLQTMLLLLLLLPLDLPVGHASSCEENVPQIASLHPTSAPNKELLDSQPFIRFLELATFPSCSCVYQITIVLRQWSQSLTKPKLASETLFTVVSPIYSPCNNRYNYTLQITLFLSKFFHVLEMLHDFCFQQCMTICYNVDINKFPSYLRVIGCFWFNLDN